MKANPKRGLWSKVQGERKRHAALLLGAAAGLWGCTGPGNNHVSNVQFFDNKNTLIESNVVGPQQTFEWDSIDPRLPAQPDALQDALVNQPVEQTGCGNPALHCGVGANFLADYPSGEADIFVVEPSFLTYDLEPANCTTTNCDPPHQSFDTVVTPSRMPAALALPPQSISNPPPPTQLNSQTFYGAAQPDPYDWNNPFGGVGVQAVRVYDHGACSLGIGWQIPAATKPGQTPLSPLLPLIDNSFWTGFANSRNACSGGDSGDGAFYALRSVAYLEHTQTFPSDGVTGGFILDGHFGVETVGWVDIYFTAKYQLGLTPANPAQGDFGGLLNVASTSCYLDTEGAFHGSVFDSFKPNLQDTLPQQFAAKAQAMQSKDILGPVVASTPAFASSRTCFPTAPNPCQNAEDVLESAISDGAQAFNQHNPPAAAFSTNTSDPNSDLSRMLAAAGAKDGSGKLTNWQCVLDNPNFSGTQDQINAAPHHCEYLVRAKRLNLYPDQVELVWYDGREVNNPTFALRTAFDAPYINQDPAILCAAPPPTQNQTRVFGHDAIPLPSGTGTDTVPCPGTTAVMP